MGAAEQLITDNLEIWSSAIKAKSAAGRGKSNKLELYGIKKLRELILDLAVRGLLVPQDPNDEPASKLLKKIAAEKAKLVKDKKIKKPKALLAIGDDEKPFDIPESWSWMRLPEIYYAISPGKKKLKSSEIQASGIYPVVDQGQEHISGFSNDKSLVIEIPGPLVVFGDHTRNIKYIDFDFVPGADGTKILCPFLIFPRYFYMYISHYDLEGRGYARHFKVLNDNLIALPPLSEQTRIVSKVDELMALCDQLEQQQETSITAHQTLVQTLLDALTTASERDGFTAAWARIAGHFDTLFTTEWSIDQLKQIILQLAVMGKLVPQDPNDEPASELLKGPDVVDRGILKLGKGKVIDVGLEIQEADMPFELPSGWELVRLGKILEVVGGSQPPKSVFKDKPQKGYTRLIQIRDFKNDNFPTYVPDEFANRPFDEEDIMIGRYGPPVFQILRGRSGTYNVALMKANALGGALSSDFLFHLLEEPRIQNLVISESERTAGQSGVRKEVIYEFVVGLPPKNEQNRIVSRVSELMVLCDTLKTRLNTAQITQLQLADAMAEQEAF